MLTVGGLQGFVFYAPSSSRGHPAACSSRRRATTGRSRSSPGTGPRSSRSRWTRRASIPTRSSRAAEPQRPAVVPVHDPDVPEPEREDALGRAPRAARRGRPRARSRRSSRTTRTASSASRARRKRACSNSRAGTSSRTRRRSRRPSRRACAAATSSSPRRTRRLSRSVRSPRTSRRRSCRRRSCTSSSPAVASSRTSATSAASCGLVATRCSQRLRARAERRLLEPSRRRVLRLGRARRRRLHGARGGGGARGRHFRAGAGVLREGLGRRGDERALRVQLRDARADRRGRRARHAPPRLTPRACGGRGAARTGSPRRSRCRRTGG